MHAQRARRACKCLITQARWVPARLRIWKLILDRFGRSGDARLVCPRLSRQSNQHVNPSNSQTQKCLRPCLADRGAIKKRIFSQQAPIPHVPRVFVRASTAAGAGTTSKVQMFNGQAGSNGTPDAATSGACDRPSPATGPSGQREEQPERDTPVSFNSIGYCA